MGGRAGCGRHTMARTAVAVGRAARRARSRPRFTRAPRRTVWTVVASASAAAATAVGATSSWPPSTGSGRRDGGLPPPPTPVRRPRRRGADRRYPLHTCRRRHARLTSSSRRFIPLDPVRPPLQTPRHATQEQTPTGRSAPAPAAAPFPDTRRVPAGPRRPRRRERTAVAAARRRRLRVGRPCGGRPVVGRALGRRPGVRRPRGWRAAGGGEVATGAPRLAPSLPYRRAAAHPRHGPPPSTRHVPRAAVGGTPAAAPTRSVGPQPQRRPPPTDPERAFAASAADGRASPARWG